MPNPDAPPLTRGVVLRGIVFGVAIALGAVAVWLIVIADSTKSMRVGVLAGIWGALLGAYSMFGARRNGSELDEPAPQPVSGSDDPVRSGQELLLRSPVEVERIAEAAARRVFEDRLEQLLRRELAREVGDLRGEIARLRQDLLDKVGGQLRLERIETTRVIGSDLEALQHEVRQLKQASETGTLHELGIGTPQRLVVEPAQLRPISRPAAAATDVTPARSSDETQPAPANDASAYRASVNGAPVNGASSNGASADDPRVNGSSANGTTANGAPANGAPANSAPANGAPTNGAPAHGPASRSPGPWTAAPPPAPAEITGPIRLPQPASAAPHSPASAAPTPAPAAPAPSAPAPAAPTPATVTPPAPSASADPFASLPRITPFTEFELDPVDSTVRTQEAGTGRPKQASASPGASATSAYTGRRRRTDGISDASGADTGRHSRHGTPEPAVPSGGRRRRAAEDDSDDDDLLSRLLARGTADH